VETPGDSGVSYESRVFLSDTPYKLMCQGKIHKVPWILGVCKDEGLLFHAARKMLYECFE
jgi:carboxylesterase type B